MLLPESVNRRSQDWPTTRTGGCARLVGPVSPADLLRSSPVFAQGIGVLIRHQLENLLRITALECDGHIVPVDSFSLPCAGRQRAASRESAESMTRPAYPRSKDRFSTLRSFEQVEPRLVMIGNLLEQLSRVVDLSHAGRAVDVDGFRLTNLEYWANYVCASLFENLNFGSISPACSCDCDFCFVKGWGPTPLERRTLTLSEATTRMKYYSSEKKRGLPVARCWPGEPFLNRNILEFLRMAREADPGRVFSITTNGDFLTRSMIRELEKLKPVSLVISLNASDPEIRRRVMWSRRPSVAVEAIPLLREHGIQFLGSIVPSPSMTLEEIADTAYYLDRHSALMIRLPLPGFTRFQAVPQREMQPWWDELVGLARSLRHDLSTPIHIQPNFYWDRNLAASIDGVYRNSPAARAGLHAGDRIEAINGQPVFTKADIIDFFTNWSPGPNDRCALSLRRNGQPLSVELVDGLSLEDDCYPFKPAGYPAGETTPDSRCLGMHVVQGFRLESLKSLKACVEKHPQARRVLLFTTPLVKAHFFQALDYAAGIPECRLDNIELRVTTAAQNYWQGNIMIGDLHVVQDFIDHLNALSDLGYRPDLALIPSSFVGTWRFDVLGGSYLDIERKTGIPVELAPAERIMW